MKRLKEIIIETALEEAKKSKTKLTREELEKDFKDNDSFQILWNCVQKWYDEKEESKKSNIQHVKQNKEK